MDVFLFLFSFFFTENKVLVVIAHDDNYDDNSDTFISRWATRKIASQFQQDLLTGPNGYVFSLGDHPKRYHRKTLSKLMGDRGLYYEEKLVVERSVRGIKLHMNI